MFTTRIDKQLTKMTQFFDLQLELELESEHSLPISLKILNLSYSLEQIINSKQILYYQYTETHSFQ